MTNPVIQRLTPADIGLMRSLNAVFDRAFEDSAVNKGTPGDDAYLAALLGKEHIAVLVATVDGAVVGGLVAIAIDKWQQAGREYYLYDLAVVEPYRRRGIATALIETLRAIAADDGAWVVFVQAERDDDPAIALYESLGKREEVLHFDIAVPARPTPSR